MKKTSKNFLAAISSKVISRLTREVKETIAFNLVEPAHRSFTTAELWNIQRHTKARIQRRFL